MSNNVQESIQDCTGNMYNNALVKTKFEERQLDKAIEKPKGGRKQGMKGTKGTEEARDVKEDT